MKENQLRKLLEEYVKTYINNIARELKEPHNRWLDNLRFQKCGFPKHTAYRAKEIWPSAEDKPLEEDEEL